MELSQTVFKPRIEPKVGMVFRFTDVSIEKIVAIRGGNVYTEVLKSKYPKSEWAENCVGQMIHIDEWGEGISHGYIVPCLPNGFVKALRKWKELNAKV
jgi:hypothetical protein